jgi:membrane fusion protein (multidrug efflux system)
MGVTPDVEENTMRSWAGNGDLSRPAIKAAGVILVLLGLLGCGGQEGTPSGGASPAGGASPPVSKAVLPKVRVAPARREPLNASREWPAQTQFGDSIDVRARVQGTLENFDFREGYGVRAGQVLFTLDDAPYQADLQAAQAKVAQAQADLTYALTQVNVRKARADLTSAKADLLSAQAKLRLAQQDVDRYKPLATNGVIPMQTLDDAVAKRDVAAAQVKVAQAQVEVRQANLRNTELSDSANIEVARANLQAAESQVTQARLNVGYCTIASPIDGVIGKLNVDPGNLVGQMGNTTPLVTISKIDPIYVNFNISEAEYLWMIQQPRSGPRVEFELVLVDGTTYAHKGRFGMVDRALDPKTGTMGVRAIFPNPRAILREGQFSRVRLTNLKPKEVVLVPQKAVVTVQSMQMVYLVDEDNKVLSRNIETAGEQGNDFIVKSGLEGGELVVVEGTQKVKPGVVCAPEEETQATTTGR